MAVLAKVIAGLIALVAALAARQTTPPDQPDIGPVASPVAEATGQAEPRINASEASDDNVGSGDQTPVEAVPTPATAPPAAAAPAPPAVEPALAAPPIQPAAPATAAKPRATKPGDVFDLSTWKLQLPDGSSEHSYPELASYTDKNFRLDDAGRGIMFRATVGGSTTPNSSYPRSELREMNGASEAAWNAKSGTHTLSVKQAVTELPPVKPQVVTAQIHDASDDIVEVLADGLHAKGKVALCVRYGGKEQPTCLDDNYTLGTQYALDIMVASGKIAISYNGQKKLEFDVAGSGSGYYFKTGCYTQSNPDKGDAPDAAGEVVIYDAKVTHR
ncbi:MAG TPA: polysaccharide lyase family 7 protein [Mycobacteriales bacterium]|nr:polysaccharide lyase family 7 protein [Mycobacteriales bacterium]